MRVFEWNDTQITYDEELWEEFMVESDNLFRDDCPKSLRYVGPIVNGKIVGEVPEIPTKVRMFENLIRLVDPPVIKGSVMEDNFKGCISLNPSTETIESYQKLKNQAIGIFANSNKKFFDGSNKGIIGADAIAQLIGFPDVSDYQDEDLILDEIVKRKGILKENTVLGTNAQTVELKWGIPADDAKVVEKGSGITITADDVENAFILGKTIIWLGERETTEIEEPIDLPAEPVEALETESDPTEVVEKTRSEEHKSIRDSIKDGNSYQVSNEEKKIDKELPEAIVIPEVDVLSSDTEDIEEEEDDDFEKMFNSTNSEVDSEIEESFREEMQSNSETGLDEVVANLAEKAMEVRSTDKKNEVVDSSREDAEPVIAASKHKDVEDEKDSLTLALEKEAAQKERERLARETGKLVGPVFKDEQLKESKDSGIIQSTPKEETEKPKQMTSDKGTVVIELNNSILDSPVRVKGNCIIENTGNSVITAECPLECYGIVTIRGTGSLILRSTSSIQPCIGNKTKDRLRSAYWEESENPDLDEIVVSNVEVVCESQTRNFSVGTYGREKMPKITVQNNGTIQLPEGNKKRTMGCKKESGKHRKYPVWYKLEG